MRLNKDEINVIRKNEAQQLNKAICQINNPNEVWDFLRDLLTFAEHRELARRLEVAYLLESGFTQSEIADLLNVGVGTVTRVNAKLKSGKGFKKIIKQLPKRTPEEKRLRQMSNPIGWYVDWVKQYMKKY